MSFESYVVSSSSVRFDVFLNCRKVIQCYVHHVSIKFVRLNYKFLVSFLPYRAGSIRGLLLVKGHWVRALCQMLWRWVHFCKTCPELNNHGHRGLLILTMTISTEGIAFVGNFQQVLLYFWTGETDKPIKSFNY